MVEQASYKDSSCIKDKCELGKKLTMFQLSKITSNIPKPRGNCVIVINKKWP